MFQHIQKVYIIIIIITNKLPKHFICLVAIITIQSDCSRLKNTVNNSHKSLKAYIPMFDIIKNVWFFEVETRNRFKNENLNATAEHCL